MQSFLKTKEKQGLCDDKVKSGERGEKMDGWGWPPKAGKGEKGKKKKKNHYLRNNWVRLALNMGQNEVLRFLVPLRVARAYHHHHRHALRTGRIGELRGENSDRGDYAPRLPFFFFFLFLVLLQPVLLLPPQLLRLLLLLITKYTIYFYRVQTRALL